MAPFRPFALVLLSACGGLAETTARPSEKDAAAPTVDAAGPAQPPVPVLLEDAGASSSPVSPVAPVDAGPSPCAAAGGTCLELIPCDGVGVNLLCDWSASCCMPATWDGGTCPPSSPTPGTPCDVSPYLTCGYAPCHDAVCGGFGADAGTWWVGPVCSPPPPGG
jgi:hypothetical protein